MRQKADAGNVQRNDRNRWRVQEPGEPVSWAQHPLASEGHLRAIRSDRIRLTLKKDAAKRIASVVEVSS